MSALVTVNGAAVSEAQLCFPRAGVWHGFLVVDESSLPPAAVAVDFAGVKLSGTIRRGASWQGSVGLQVVGGAGGLTRPARVKAYRATTARIVAQDLLAAAGERLAGSSSPAVLGTVLQAWSVLGQSVGQQLNVLVDNLGPSATWRVLRDGTVWLGTESWGACSAAFDVLGEHPQHGRVELAFDGAPDLQPGQTLGGRRVGYVEHRLRDGAFRTSALFEDTL